MNRACCFALLLAVCLPARADDYAELFREAAEAVDWNIEDNWAFTETRLVDEAVWIARFDPRRQEDLRWILVSVDGRDPTESELREFRDDKNDYDTEENSDQVEIVGAESLELVDEDETSWNFRFVPEDDEPDFADKVDGTVRIRKDGPWIEFIDLRNHADISPGFGSKIRTLLVHLEFGPAIDNGPIVPKRIEVQVSGRAMLFISFSETELISYSDFEFAGDSL